MRHFKALDGLRALAVLAVVAYHLDASVRGGALGVDVFFVISGYLITTLLVREWEGRGSVSFSAFYMRRALRLLPAFYAVFVVAVLLAETITKGPEAHATISGLPWVFFYAGNLHASYGHSDLGLLGATWSLAEEEQFYFLWPAICVLLLATVTDRRRVALGLAAVAVVEMAYRFLLIRHGADVLSRIQYGPDTRSDGLLAGCALAFVMLNQGHTGASGEPPAKSVVGVGLMSGVTLAVLLLVAPMNRAAGFEFAIPLAVLTTAALIWSLSLAPVGPLHWLLETRIAVWLGRRSYGLYLWHFPIILGIPLVGLSHAERLPIHLSLAVGAAALSYRFIELPFLRRKHRWQTDRQRA